MGKRRSHVNKRKKNKDLAIRLSALILLPLLTIGSVLLGITSKSGYWRDFLMPYSITFVIALVGGVLFYFSGLAAKLPKIELTKKQALIIFPAAMFILCWLVAAYAFKYFPYVGDSYIQLLQAKIFASGHLYLPSEQPVNFFKMIFMINDGRFYSQYPPMHQSLLALFVLVKMPWLLNPVAAAISIALVYLLTLEVANRRTANIAAILTLCSQYIVYMGGEYMSHMTALIFALSFTLFYIRADKTRSIDYAALAGLMLGLFLLTRPFSAVGFAVPFGIHWLIQAKSKNFTNRSLAFIGGVLPGVILYMLYNYLTTGDALVTGYARYNELSSKEAPVDLALSWARFKFTYIRLFQLNDRLFNWPFPSLFFLLLAFMLRFDKKYCFLLVAPILTMALSLIFTPFHDNFFQPRYIFESVGGAIILTAICIAELPAYLKKKLKLKRKPEHVTAAIHFTVAILFLMSIPRQIVTFESYAHDYGPNSRALFKQMMKVKYPALILVKPTPKDAYAATYFYPLNKKQPVIAARDLSEKNQIISRYPDRYVYQAGDNSVKLLKKPDAAKPAARP